MASDYKAKKIVAVLDPGLPLGKAMNALGHLAFSAGHYTDHNSMGKEELIDKEGQKHVGIARYPFIVLQALPSELKELYLQARSAQLFCIGYPEEMFATGPDEELVAAIQRTSLSSLTFHALLLVGDAALLKQLTGHLRLYS